MANGKKSCSFLQHFTGWKCVTLFGPLYEVILPIDHILLTLDGVTSFLRVVNVRNESQTNMGSLFQLVPMLGLVVTGIEASCISWNILQSVSFSKCLIDEVQHTKQTDSNFDVKSRARNND